MWISGILWATQIDGEMGEFTPFEKRRHLSLSSVLKVLDSEGRRQNFSPEARLNAGLLFRFGLSLRDEDDDLSV